MCPFKYYELKLVIPSFDSEITDLILELDHLRRKKIKGTTPQEIFLQLKDIFHILESIGSTRIEGNHTTIAEYIEYKSTGKTEENEGIKEIRNMEEALDFVDHNIDNTEINRRFLSELHKIVVKGLKREGSKRPGKYRNTNLNIAQARHTPPDYIKVKDYMEEFFDFLNREAPSKYDLIKTALAHHRFVWIHPFDNGNGRVVRLLTYAMLIKQGFNVQLGDRIINPTAIFCVDRDKYYNYLSIADKGDKESLLKWCNYVLAGLDREIKKIANLLNYKYVKKNILSPALKFANDRNLLKPSEYEVLKVAITNGVFKNSDVKESFDKDKQASAISRQLRNLKEKGLITTTKDSKRKYVINFSNNYLMRGVIIALRDNKFLPENEVV
jgi:Fic family protein